MTEHDIQNRLLMEISKRGDMTPFRVNVGMAWQGKASKVGRDVLIENPRPFKTGLPAGFPDVIIAHRTNDGCELIMLEIKTEKGRLSENQKKFLTFMRDKRNCRVKVCYGLQDGLDFINTIEEG